MVGKNEPHWLEDIVITCIREVRRARGQSLQQVADACLPPTTAQTIGRLETGTRTVSLGWLARIARALEVDPADLLTLPTQADLPVVAILGADGAIAPRHPGTIVAPRPAAGQVAIRVTVATGNYRAGDEIWCDRLPPEAIARALNRDVLIPSGAGRLLFGRLLACDDGRLSILPPASEAAVITVDRPAWIGQAVRLIRAI